MREEDGQELEREAEMLKQENDKRNEEEPLLREDEIALPGTAEEESITEQERDEGVETQEENGDVDAVNVAKNVILSGVKAVTVHDTENVTMVDLGAQSFLRESEVRTTMQWHPSSEQQS